MGKPAKRPNGKYIEARYGDKVVFKPKKKGRHGPAFLAAWRRSQGLWKNHPVFRGMTVKEIIESLRGADCDV